jgi:hypothetical protein
MRSLIIIIAALATVLIVGISGANAVAQASPGSYHQALAGGGMSAIAMNTTVAVGEPPQGRVPGGDYQLTCRDISTDGHMLKASCQKRDGSWRTSSLDTRNCSSQINNDNGQLRCAQGGTIPPGDYRLTCENIHVNGQRLDASCKKEDGSFRQTSLDNFYRCGNRISNIDGQLRCGK